MNVSKLIRCLAHYHPWVGFVFHFVFGIVFDSDLLCGLLISIPGQLVAGGVKLSIAMAGKGLNQPLSVQMDSLKKSMDKREEIRQKGRFAKMVQCSPLYINLLEKTSYGCVQFIHVLG